MTGTPELPPGFHLVALDETASTNDDAKARAAAGGLAEGITVVWAKHQTAGRGRLARTWVSQPGNLFCTFLVPHHAPVARMAEMGFVAGLAVAEAIAGFVPAGVAVTCKWPNDVLVDGKKAAGVLLESASTGGEAASWVVVGIGINVASHPAETIYPATSLSDAGATASIEHVLEALAERFHAGLARWQADGFAPVRDGWVARAEGIGETATVDLGTEKVTGVFAGLDISGAMLLQTEDGARRINAGDVYFPNV
jgi:BirA family biotin operon repressor/biotin-[acetyl-CoA-carboxylase] ligase